jgi:single-stranded-DNA-specific exonuclease
MNYFEQFLNSRKLDAEALNKLFSYEKVYIEGTDVTCDILHSLPRDVKIGCLSDYDTDGIFAGVCNFLGLHLLGFRNVSIAHRDVTRGYSFTALDIDNMGDVDIIITSDVGISCYEAIAYAKSKGIYVIVTDHHIPVQGGISNNQADILIDWLLDKKFAAKSCEVCGAYTVYQIYERYVELYPNDFVKLSEVQSDLVKIRHLAAIATVADSMSLTGRNHYIVSQMLKFFNYINPMNANDDIVKSVCYNPVVQNVYNNLHTFISASLDAYYVGFDMRFLEYSIIPVINCIKRMADNVAIVYNMLFGTPEMAAEAAQYMVELNAARKELVADLFETMYTNHEDQLFDNLIYVTDGPGGVLGLLAAKVMNATGLPSVVLNKTLRFDDETGVWVYDGSIRSPKWYPFFSRAMESGYATCSGHEFACAITVPVQHLADFYQYLLSDIERYGIFTDVPVTKAQRLEGFDVVLDYDENFFDFIPDVEQFMFDMKEHAPFGVGFPEPEILLRFNKVHGSFKTLKDGIHTKITIAPNFDVLLWNTTIEEVEASTDKDIVFVKGYLATSYFQGKQSINFVAEPVFQGDEVE